MAIMKQCYFITIQSIIYYNYILKLLNTILYSCSLRPPHRWTYQAARVVCNDHRQTSSVSGMLKILNWPSLQNRRRAASLRTLFKIKEGEVKIKSDHLHPVQARSRRGNDQQYATRGFVAKMTSDCILSFEELSKIGTHWHSIGVIHISADA